MFQKGKIFQGSIALAICFLLIAITIVVVLSYQDFNYSKSQAALSPVSNKKVTLTVKNVFRGSGTGGKITSNPAGNIDCGIKCSMGFGDYLKKVTLYAKPDSHSKFVKWSGDCSSKGSCLIFNPKTDKKVTATFCSDECTAFDSTRCSGTSELQTCKRDSDGVCLIWVAKKCSGSTNCDYGYCTAKQRPQWYCSNGACAYTCYNSSSCK